MSQRHSGYELTENETYITPAWVWKVLYQYDAKFKGVAYDPCPPNYEVDYLTDTEFHSVIATNPPFSLADKMVRHAIKHSASCAFLLPNNWDTAKGRVDLFRDSKEFIRKIVLCDRIRWENLEQKENGPSTNHAWYIWQRAGPFHKAEITWFRRD